MVFVQRDQNGQIVGLYANKQPGYAEEELADDGAEVIAFRDRPVPPLRDLAAEIDALKTVLIEEDPTRRGRIEAEEQKATR